MSDDAFGLVKSPAYDLPLSSYLSEAGGRSYIGWTTPPAWFPAKDADTAEIRRWFDETTIGPRLDKARLAYSARVEAATMAGVPVQVVSPTAALQPGRILVNMHGGGFRLGGGGPGGLLEALPVAAATGVTVVSVDYRMAPEHAHPAGVEDVEAVYREILKTHAPQDVGLYGVSAGGVLASQAAARFRKAGLPAPGALALICAGGEATFGGGDSLFTSAAAKGAPPPPASPNPPTGASPAAYLAGADLSDPLVSPAVDLDTLKAFPPTLLLTATRDFELSAAAWMHRRLLAAGARAELVVWDGLGHGFTYDTDTPETQEAFAILARFFAEHLGKITQG